MSGIYIREFEAADGALLAGEAVDKELAEYRDRWLEWAKYNGLNGPAYTGFHNGVMVGAAGAVVNAGNVATMWVVFSTKINGCKGAAFRMVKDMLDIFGEACEFRKVRAISRVGFDKSQRLLEHLGFVNRGRIKNTEFYLYIQKQSVISCQRSAKNNRLKAEC